MKQILLSIAFYTLCQANAQQLLKHNYLIEDDLSKSTGDVIKIDNYSSLVNNLSGGFNVLPNIKFSVDYYTKDKQLMAAARIFFASSNIDSLIPNRANQLYFPEASKFGFNIGGSFGFGKILRKITRKTDNSGDSTTQNSCTTKSAKSCSPSEKTTPCRHVANRFAINGNFFYLIKNLKDTSLKAVVKEANAHLVHLKLGLEWAIERNHLSAFANFNYAVPLTQRDFFKETFNYTKFNYMFTDVGFQLRASIVEEKIDSYLTLGSIIHSSDTRSLSGGTDKIVPYVKLGLNINLR